MAIDVSSAGALRRRVDLQGRLWEAAHGTFHRIPGSKRPVEARSVEEAASGKQLYRDIRTYLIKASDHGLILEAQSVVHRDLLFAGPDSKVFLHISVGNVRNYNRTKELPHFSRQDGGWFDFQLQVKEEDGRADIVAYDFELRLPPGAGFEFVRFDLNPPGHENQKHGLRSHFHINADDDGLVAPSPVMSPFEILDLFLHGLCRVGRIRGKPQLKSSKGTE